VQMEVKGGDGPKLLGGRVGREKRTDRLKLLGGNLKVPGCRNLYPRQGGGGDQMEIHKKKWGTDVVWFVLIANPHQGP